MGWAHFVSNNQNVKRDVLRVEMFIDVDYIICTLLFFQISTRGTEGGCSRDEYPVLYICNQQSLAARVFFVDFSTFEVDPSPYCACDIVIHQAFYLEIESQSDNLDSRCGTRVSMGPFPYFNARTHTESPVYREYQCKNDKDRMEREELYGNELLVSIEELTSKYSQGLCMRFEVEAWNGSMTIQCHDPLKTVNVTYTTVIPDIPTSMDTDQDCHVTEVSYSLGSLLIFMMVGVAVVSYCYYHRRILIKASETVYMGLTDPSKREKRKVVSTLSDHYSDETQGQYLESKSAVYQEDIYDEIYYH